MEAAQTERALENNKYHYWRDNLTSLLQWIIGLNDKFNDHYI